MVFEETTQGIVVRVEPRFQMQESDPAARRFVWSYRVEIENRSRETVRLINREWSITDAAGQRQEIQGAGVVGQQPLLRPGERFQYTSAAPLRGPSGVMVGRYEMERAITGERFFIAIPAFALDSPLQSKLAN